MDVLEELVDKIAAESGKTKERVYKLIREKQDELSGLVSKHGAAYMVGRELGVSLIKEGRTLLKASNLVPGLFSVDIVARVLNVFEPREFESKGRAGRVQNIMLGDETGTVRMSLWNQELDLVQRLGIKEGAAVEIRGGYTKQDNMGNPELRVGKGTIKVTEGKDLPKPEDIPGVGAGLQQAGRAGGLPASAKRRRLSELKEGDFAEVRAALVQLFSRNPFYEVCPTCGSRVSQQGDTWACKEHGQVEPAHQMVAAGFIDDGEGNMRAVFFREAAEKVFGRNAEELRRLTDEKKAVEAAFEGLDSLGKEFVLRGRAGKNSFTGNLEFVVNEVEDMDPKKETEELLKGLEK